MNDKKKFMPIFAAALILAMAPYASAAVVNVFLDDGAHVSGSSNSGTPFANDDRDITWDVTATAESGLADIGAAVMTVRMVPFNVNGDSRGASTAGGNGLAVKTGSNDQWFDGSTGEAALFQFSFYSDLAKTTEITGLDIGLASVVSRVQTGTSKMVDAFVGSGTLTFNPSTNFNNSTDVLLGGTLLSTANDTTNSFDSALGIKTTNDTMGVYTMTAAVGSIDSFSENDSLWVRRRNTTVGDDAYQLSALSFNVETSSAGYSAWIGGYNLTNGLDAAEADPDGDGVKNLYEYGLGGDPTNSMITGTLPTFEIMDQGSSNVCEYIHVQRTDSSSGIAYEVQQASDLGTAAWTNNGISIAGESSVIDGFKTVTNRTPADSVTKFIRLQITEE